MVTSERDAALSQVETLQAGKLEAERLAAELKAELRSRDQREASLRDDVTELEAMIARLRRGATKRRSRSRS